MSGRAGRRGFDPVGNVVFFGVPYKKIKRLITANVPKLVGNFPISVSLVLRLLLMSSKGDDKNDALAKVVFVMFSCKMLCLFIFIFAIQNRKFKKEKKKKR